MIRANPVVWRAFVLTGLSHYFSTFRRLDDALARRAQPYRDSVPPSELRIPTLK